MRYKKKEVDKRLWGILTVLVIAVLILLLVLSGRKKGAGKTEETTVQTSALSEMSWEERSGNTLEDAVSGKTADLSALTLEKDTNEELTALVQRYGQAKQEQDLALLGQVFGTNDVEKLEGEQADLDHMSQLTDSYQAISCYYVAGPEKDTYVIYPYFEILYREAEVAMPYLTWSYVKRNEGGQLYMVSDLEQEELEYVQAVSQLEEVKLLQKDVEERQKQALEQDDVLRQMFEGTSQSGSMVELQPAKTVSPQEIEHSQETESAQNLESPQETESTLADEHSQETHALQESMGESLQE